MVSFVLSIPCSNAYAERAFSLMNMIRADQRNRCSVDLVKAELQVKLNYRFSCLEFYQFVRSNAKLLESVRSDRKYTFK
ncbi:UNVERIFIED_CONTAM: hypothetical protein FKN15_014077 [Acipenser sinensis]